MTTGTLIWALLIGVALNLLLALWLLLRPRQPAADELAHRQLLQSQNQQIALRVERVETELRREIGDSARIGRQEIQQTLGSFQEAVSRQSAEALRAHRTRSWMPSRSNWCSCARRLSEPWCGNCRT